MSIKAIATAVLVTFGLASTSVFSATVTNTMPVRITIQNACNISTTAPTMLDFGTQGPLVANIDQTSTITVTCTNLAPYNVGLNGGVSGSVTARTMLNGTTPVNYSLFRDSARTLNWGNTVGTDTVSGTGNGTAQSLTVYGQVPASQFVTPGSYADTITATISY